MALCLVDKIESELEGESSGLKSYSGDTLHHIEDAKSQIIFMNGLVR